MTFGYPQLYANGLNNTSQIRRSTDMIYQRGGNYQVTLTGDTYNSSMVLDVQLYSEDSQVGSMRIVPFDVSEDSGTYTYNFNIRPYDYFSNYIKSEHYKYYWLNDWYSTNSDININKTYSNSVKCNIKYRYQYLVNNQYTGETSYNDYNHYTDIPFGATSTGFTSSGFTNTGNYFDYVGGSFQMGRDKFYLPNFDQELGSVIGTGLTVNTLDINRSLSPMSQYLMDYPYLPEMSKTARFLTDAPRIQSITENESYVLYYLNGQTGDRQVIQSDFVLFEFYDDNNTLLTSFSEELSYSGTTYETPTGFTDNLKIFALPCGPKDITNIFATIDYSQVSYYRVQIFYGFSTSSTSRVSNGPIGPTSEIFYFYVEENCGPEDTRLTFLNARGGYDYFTFNKYRNDIKKINRQTYDNRYYSTSISSPDRDYGRTVKTFDTEVEREFVLESDYLNESFGDWLEQLFYSPQVYEMKEDFISPLDRQDKVYKDLRPIQILSTEVETINTKHKKLNKYRITCKYADGYFVSKGF